MLGRKYNSQLIQSVEDYLLANFIVETKGYIGNFNDQNYYDWMDRMSRLETPSRTKRLNYLKMVL